MYLFLLFTILWNEQYLLTWTVDGCVDATWERWGNISDQSTCSLSIFIAFYFSNSSWLYQQAARSSWCVWWRKHLSCDYQVTITTLYRLLMMSSFFFLWWQYSIYNWFAVILWLFCHVAYFLCMWVQGHHSWKYTCWHGWLCSIYQYVPDVKGVWGLRVPT